MDYAGPRKLLVDRLLQWDISVKEIKPSLMITTCLPASKVYAFGTR